MNVLLVLLSSVLYHRYHPPHSGRGRDAEFKAIGKRVINPVHDHAGVFDEHDRDQRNRQVLHLNLYLSGGLGLARALRRAAVNLRESSCSCNFYSIPLSGNP